MEIKRCTNCKEVKSLDYFNKSNQVKSGRTAHCKACAAKMKAESNQRIRELDPDGWAERRREYMKTYRERHPDKVREQARKRNLNKFGVTVEQYDSLLDSQGGACRICKVFPEESRRLAVDHDHKCCPGKKSCGDCVRALLCSKCNTALGLVSDDTERLEGMTSYIEDYR